MNPLLTDKPILTFEQTKALFGNVLEIKAIHELFLDELSEVIPSWTEDTLLGNHFIKLVTQSGSVLILFRIHI